MLLASGSDPTCNVEDTADELPTVDQLPTDDEHTTIHISQIIGVTELDT